MKVIEITNIKELPKGTLAAFAPPYYGDMYEESIDIYKSKHHQDPEVIYKMGKNLYIPIGKTWATG